MKLLLAAIVPAAAAMVLWAQPAAQFRTNVRLVEVYATVRDNHGKYLDGLEQSSFRVLDNGEAQPLVSFESDSKHISCAILIDTTGSMAAVLPSVKNSVVRMLDELRADDEVAVYGFSTVMNTLQDFTTDKAKAKQAVLRTHAGGSTALFDAISQLAYDISSRSGKKAIVVFTDGADNASVLNARAAVSRAKKTGVPLYSIAEGEALTTKTLLGELKDLAEATGGQTFQVHKPSEIAGVFQQISGDLQHTYMLAYKPPPAADGKWRTIQIAVNGVKEPKIRAKEGYIPE